MEEPIAEVMILEVGVDMVGQVVRVMGDMEVLVVVTGVGVAMRPALEVAVELPFMVVVEEDMVVLVVVDIILMGGRKLKSCILGPKNPYSQVRSWLLFSVSFISSPRCS